MIRRSYKRNILYNNNSQSLKSSRNINEQEKEIFKNKNTSERNEVPSVNWGRTFGNDDGLSNIE